MGKIVVDSEYFNVLDTLECGQIFRYKPYKDGSMVFSLDKACFVRNFSGKTEITCNLEDRDYFYNYFDLERDYSAIFDRAISDDVSIVKTSAMLGKGIRILNQNLEEALFSFIISQNNNIPRIKSIIEKLCSSLGTKKSFFGEEYFAFPSAKEMAKLGIEFYKSLGLGYRADYILGTATLIAKGLDLFSYKELSTKELKAQLKKIKGIGTKVADCVALFGFHRADSFPVDTWIEKVYREDFLGTLTDIDKITNFFIDRYGEYSGYIQQYLFYYKRSLEKKK